jgi:hypothetical protein
MKNLQKTFDALTKKQRIPILSMGWVIDGYFHVSNLEIQVKVKTNFENGFYTLIKGVPFFQEPLTEEAIVPVIFDKNLSFEVEKEELLHYLELQPCCAKDELCPVLGGIYIDDECMVATNAYVIRIEKHSSLLPMKGIIPNHNAIAEFIARNDRFLFTQKINDNHTWGCLYNDTEEISWRYIEGTYPNYKSVIPEKTDTYKCFQITKTEINDLVEWAKKINPNLPMVGVYPDAFRLINIDTNLKKDLSVTMVPNPLKPNDGILMPMEWRIPEEHIHTPEIAFNAVIAKKLFTGVEKITFGYSEPNRTMVIWIDKPEKHVVKHTTKNDRESTKTVTSPKIVTTMKTKETIMQPGTAKVTIKAYSEKAFVVIGETKPIKDLLHAAGGRWNKFLKNEDGTNFSAWIFSNKKRAEVEILINQ